MTTDVLDEHLKYQRMRTRLGTVTVSEFPYFAREVKTLIGQDFNPVYLDSLVHCVLVRGMELLQGTDPRSEPSYATVAVRTITQYSLDLQHTWVAAVLNDVDTVLTTTLDGVTE